MQTALERFRPHKHQDKVFDSKARYIGVISGIRGGKTTVGAVWLLNRIYQDFASDKYGDYLIAAPTIKILEQSTLPKFKEFFPPDWGTWKEQKSCFELKWKRPGSDEPCRIFVRSMDDPNSIEGMECLAIWADEVGQMKGEAWSNMVGRLSITQGPMLMTSTPYSMNWFYTEVFKKARAGDPLFEIITWSSADNPAFPRSEYENAKRILPAAIFERRYNGKFTRLEGLVYPEFDEDIHVVDPFKFDDQKALRFGGMDFGRNNPNAVTCIFEDKSVSPSIFYVYREFYRAEVLLQELANFLKYENLAYTLADSQGAQLIAELQHYHGVRGIKEADKGIDAGIERIRMLLIEGRLKFFRTCTHTIEEIKEYHYAAPSMEKNAAEKPVPKNNHAMDALRYAFSRPLAGLYANRPKKDFKKLMRNRSRKFEALSDITGY